MGLAVNLLAAAILAVSILFYVVVYTVWLKRRTPQNIVIGGAAGAFPALIGWPPRPGGSRPCRCCCSPSSSCGPRAFWALALFINSDLRPCRRADAAGHRRAARDRIQIMLYTVPMAIAAVAPWAMG